MGSSARFDIVISVLMPVKNAATWLPHCLDSIVAQSHPDWQLLAVDDHSTDDSALILKKYEEDDKRIRLLRNRGRGIVPALQTAIEEAGGKYVTRMDADDIMPPRKLELLQRALADGDPRQVALGLVKYLDEPKPGRGFLRYARWLNGLTREGRNWEEVYKECVIPSPCWMMRRQELEELGIFRRLRYPEDYHLCLELYEAGYGLVPVPEILHLWRDHPGRASRTDPHYADQAFLDLKLDYFLRLEPGEGNQLFLWGAGPKGKEVAKALNGRKTSFQWVTGNSKKQDHKVYGRKIGHPYIIAAEPSPLVVCAVSQRGAREEMDRFLQGLGLKVGRDYFHFY